MGVRYLLEIGVESAERAAAAERGGADRIELCANLAIGGLTPAAALMRAVQTSVTLPVYAMVRPRGGDFVYSEEEFSRMKREIALVRECGMDGVVLGLLRKDGRIDLDRTGELVELAKPLPVTFHRAFDECRDLEAAVEDAIAAGCARVLTSGGAATALKGQEQLALLVRSAGTRIGILPGGGITARNAAEIARVTGACEFHAALSSAVEASATADSFAGEVERLAATLRASARDEQSGSPWPFGLI